MEPTNMKKKYHYFYRITNKLNDHFYFGVHNTDNIEDGYMGSGKRLHYAFKKYGIENFEKEILKFFSTEQEAFEFESEIVTESLVKADNCYNISVGGKYLDCTNKAVVKDKDSNYFLIDKTDERFINNQVSGITFGMVPVKDASGSVFLVDKNDKRIKNGKLNYLWTGRKHTKKTREKMSNTHKKNNNNVGAKNSQFGTCWVTNGTENKKIKIKDFDEFENNGWKKGRVVSDEFKLKMSEVLKAGQYQTGKNNSQYNTKWVVKDNCEKKIPNTEIKKYLAMGYELGRKKK